MLLRVRDIADRLCLSMSKVYDLVETRQIGHYKIGGAIRISEEQLTEFLDQTRQERGASERSTRRLPHPRLRHLKT
jgi:excisionase family DNA binding protein